MYLRTNVSYKFVFRMNFSIQLKQLYSFYCYPKTEILQCLIKSHMNSLLRKKKEMSLIKFILIMSIYLTKSCFLSKLGVTLIIFGSNNLYSWLGSEKTNKTVIDTEFASTNNLPRPCQFYLFKFIF